MLNIEDVRMPKDTNITMDEARALVADQALWPLVRGFLWDFAPQVHESWIEEIHLPDSLDIRGSHEHPGLLEKLKGASRVKAWLLVQLGVEPCFHVFPKDDWSRLVLLDGATLESIAKWLGALACVDDLRRVTDGKTVRQLKADFPDVYPAVFGFAMYFKGLDFQGRDAENRNDDAGPVGETMLQEGMAILLGVLSGLPAPLVARFTLKLPKKLSASAPGRLNAEVCSKAVSKLLKLKFPEAYKLCC